MVPELLGLINQCATQIHPQTMAAIVRVESGYNAYAIGVVGGHLTRQPRSKEEALATVSELKRQGYNFSLGISQVNRYQLEKNGLNFEQAFDPCKNLQAGAYILSDCYKRAVPVHGDQQAALRAAFSCYYSGNFRRGFIADRAGEPSYVQKVLMASDAKEAVLIKSPTQKVESRIAINRLSPRSKEENPVVVFKGEDFEESQAYRPQAIVF